MKDKIKRFLKRRLQIMYETRALKHIPALPCPSEALRTLTDEDLAEILNSTEIQQDWMQIEVNLRQVCQIEDGEDWRCESWRPESRMVFNQGLRSDISIVEIGTHVGASTLYIAAALQSLAQQDPAISPHLVTVDMQDVNSEVSGYWKQYGLMASPRDMVQALRCSDLVDFVTEKSYTYFDRCKERFDFIFLDGSHSAPTVYQEIPRALNVLKENGVILLHDYFPKNRPIWDNGSVIPGPYLAVTRLRREGAPIKVIPLGNLQWETKLGSRKTSLALVAR